MEAEHHEQEIGINPHLCFSASAEIIPVHAFERNWNTGICNYVIEITSKVMHI